MPQSMPLPTMIDESSTRKRMYRTKRAEFGNGYSQEAPDGINNVRDEWNISWKNLLDTERSTVVAALDAVQGWDYLTWTAPGDSTQKRFKVVDGWSESTTANLWSITTTVRQVY